MQYNVAEPAELFWDDFYKLLISLLRTVFDTGEK